MFFSKLLKQEMQAITIVLKTINVNFLFAFVVNWLNWRYWQTSNVIIYYYNIKILNGKIIIINTKNNVTYYNLYQNSLFCRHSISDMIYNKKFLQCIAVFLYIRHIVAMPILGMTWIVHWNVFRKQWVYIR